MARRAVEKDDTPKYEPTIYNYKCREDSSSRSPTPSPPAIKEEPVLENFGKDVTVHYTKSPHDGEHSDNCSEVSDEGYRSLGAVQPTGGNGNSGTQGSPTVADCQSKRVFTSMVSFLRYFRVEKFSIPASGFMGCQECVGWHACYANTACCNTVGRVEVATEIREWRKFFSANVCWCFRLLEESFESQSFKRF